MSVVIESHRANYNWAIKMSFPGILFIFRTWIEPIHSSPVSGWSRSSHSLPSKTSMIGKISSNGSCCLWPLSRKDQQEGPAKSQYIHLRGYYRAVLYLKVVHDKAPLWTEWRYWYITSCSMVWTVDRQMIMEDPEAKSQAYRLFTSQSSPSHTHLLKCWSEDSARSSKVETLDSVLLF